MYSCSRCHGTMSYPLDKCPHCGVLLSGVRCQGCGYTGTKTEFISNQNLCPKCGRFVRVPGASAGGLPAFKINLPAFLRRAAAYFIDYAILILFYVALSPLLAGIPAALRMTLLFALIWSYSALLEGCAMQATIGKRLLGLKVTDLDGNRITFARATARFAAKLLSGFILGIGYLMAAVTDKEQGLHDKIVSTLVVKRETQ
jgi:uncharacterized RDD family membrane protein YckC